MSIRSVIIKHKDIKEMIKKVYDWHDRSEYKYLNNDITINCKYDMFKDLFGGHYVRIYIDNILVFEDGYIHNIPKEMKQQIKLEAANIKLWNKEQIKNGIYDKYNNLLKNEKAKRKEREKQKFLNEQKYLLDKYK